MYMYMYMSVANVEKITRSDFVVRKLNIRRRSFVLNRDSELECVAYAVSKSRNIILCITPNVFNNGHIFLA